MDKPTYKFKDRLREAMLLANMKAIELSDLSGIPKPSISQYLSGYAIPKTDRTYIISKILNVNPVWLMGYDVPMNSEHPQQIQQKEHEQNLIKKYRCLSPQGKTTVDNLIDNLISVEKSSPDKENNLETLPKHNELIGHGMVAFGGNKNKFKD